MLYKLKMDLPTFKAGDIFYLDQNGSLRHKDKGIVAYHYSTLEKFPEALERFWEPVEEEYKRWRAYQFGMYYHLGSSGTVIKSLELGTTGDANLHAIGNYFKTEAEAEAVADYLKALVVVRDDAKGFKPNWEEGGQKWFVRKEYHANNESGLCIDFTCAYQENGVFGLPYFRTENDAKASIKKHRREWETIFGVKDETGSGDE